MTWWLWLVLVLGALVLFALLGLGLWRRVKRLGAELRRLEELTVPLAEAGGVAPPAPTFLPGFLTSDAGLATARRQRLRNIATRRVRRRDRAAVARARWHDLGLG